MSGTELAVATGRITLIRLEDGVAIQNTLLPFGSAVVNGGFRITLAFAKLADRLRNEQGWLGPTGSLKLRMTKAVLEGFSCPQIGNPSRKME